MDLFRMENFSFTYEGRNVPALSQMSFSVAPGEFVAICGRSGGGKSTLLKMLKTRLRPRGQGEGAVYFAGRLLDHVPLAQQEARIGFVMQRPEEQLDESAGQTVEDVLLAGLRKQKLSQDTARLRVGEMASFFGLQGWFGREVKQLSGGQRQLLSLAAAMALQPEVLLLDEPTSQLDPISANEFLETVAKLNRETGVGVLLCEHRLEEVLPLADRALVVDEGTIPVYAPPGRAALRLWELGHPMGSAMPTPVRIYEGLCLSASAAAAGKISASGSSETTEPSASGSFETAERSHLSLKNGILEDRNGVAPLTVREGREFLSRYLGNTAESKVEILSPKPEDPVTKEERPAATAEQPAEKGGWRTKAKNIKKSDHALISVKEVWFRYTREGQDVVRNLNLDIPRQKLFCLMGGNGTGKTTTLRLLAGDRKPYRGRIRKGEETPDCMRLPQDPRELFGSGTVREQLEQAWNRRFSPQNGERTKEEALQWAAEQMEIQDFLNFSPGRLSGGEQQRTALALVFLSQAKLLLLDEPTKGMDSHYKKKFGQLLGHEVDSGKTIVMVSHDVEFCAEHGDLCAMFFDGGVVSEGEPHEFFAGNSFYTTAANRMSRHLFPDAITVEDVIRRSQARL